MPPTEDVESAFQQTAEQMIGEPNGTLTMTDVLLGVVMLLGPAGLNDTRRAARPLQVQPSQEVS